MDLKVRDESGHQKQTEAKDYNTRDPWKPSSGSFISPSLCSYVVAFISLPCQVSQCTRWDITAIKHGKVYDFTTQQDRDSPIPSTSNVQGRLLLDPVQSVPCLPVIQKLCQSQPCWKIMAAPFSIMWIARRGDGKKDNQDSYLKLGVISILLFASCHDGQLFI